MLFSKCQAYSEKGNPSAPALHQELNLSTVRRVLWLQNQSTDWSCLVICRWISMLAAYFCMKLLAGMFMCLLPAFWPSLLFILYWVNLTYILAMITIL